MIINRYSLVSFHYSNILFKYIVDVDCLPFILICIVLFYHKHYLIFCHHNLHQSMATSFCVCSFNFYTTTRDISANSIYAAVVCIYSLAAMSHGSRLGLCLVYYMKANELFNHLHPTVNYLLFSQPAMTYIRCIWYSLMCASFSVYRTSVLRCFHSTH